MDSNNFDRLLTAAALAGRLGIPVKRVRAAIRSGDLPAFRVGRWWRVRTRDAERWLRQRRYLPPHDSSAREHERSS